MRYALLVAVTAGLGAGWALAAVPPPVALARHSQALQPVVVSATAAERVRQAAENLAQVLGRMAGAEFAVTTGDGSQGVAVGLPGDFPVWKELARQFAPQALDQREKYLLRSHSRGLYLVGATPLAVEDAVWDLLHRLGYRQFFPGPTWEVTPRTPHLNVAVDAWEKPDYLARRIWYGYGTWPENKAAYDQWCARNRALAGVDLRSGHAYDQILRDNKAEFAAHPEYLGLIKGERQSTKFCLANPGLRKLVVDWALRGLEKDPTVDSLSVEPSDGGDWCQCDPCRALGSVSDRALTLANEVAAAVQPRFPGKLVGIYAYNEHSPPPGLPVHPQVVVGVATAFIRGGFTVDELVSGWRKQGATLGIREYYGVNVWDRDLPGAARAGKLSYLTETLPRFHAQGARYLSAESSENWGPNGLGYYLAARLMWDTGEAKAVAALRADFLDRAFGPARPPLEGFYGLLDGDRTPPLCGDLVGRMYRGLQAGRKLTTDPAITARLDDLTLYTRYVELWLDYSEARGEARQTAGEALLRHAYRMRGRHMVHSLALYRDLPERDRGVQVPEEARWNVPEPRNPWKSSVPFTREELDQFLTAGIAAHPIHDLPPLKCSARLTPVTPLRLPAGDVGTTGTYGRNTQRFLTCFAPAPATLALKVTGGLIPHYRDRGDVQITLTALSDQGETVMDQAAVPPDGETREIVLKTTRPGLHRLQLSDGGDATRVEWSAGTPMTLESGMTAPAALHGRWTLYGYVPRGTRIVGGFASGEGELRDGSGQVRHRFTGPAGYFAVPVPPGEEGRLWQWRQMSGQVRLITIPPYLARSGAELLLPEELVKADAAR